MRLNKIEQELKGLWKDYRSQLVIEVTEFE